MKNIFRSLLLSVAVLSAGFAVSCTEPEPEHFNGTPTIEVAPAELTMPLAGGTTEAVAITTPAEWSIEITGATDVTASTTEGFGNAAVTFEVPAVTSMRTIKAIVTATGYISGYPITKKAEITIVQSDNVLGSKIYYENCGDTIGSKSSFGGKWPYVDAYTGWNPQGGEGFDQSGVTYTGKNASVRNSGKEWTPVDAIYATDAPYAYLQAKDGVEFIIHNINIKSGVKSYTFSFTAHNQYANLIDSPYTPAPVSPLKSGENLTVEVSVDGTNFGAITFTTMADGNWEYAIAPFTLPADADKLFVRFSGYKEDKTTPLPSSEYQYQAALRFDDFTLTEGGDGPVVDFNNTIGGGGNTGGGDEPTPEPAEGIYASDVPFVCATDDSTNAVYSLAATTIDGQAATGFKLGKSKQQGKFTSAAVGVSGTKYINFFGAAWKGTTATLYFRVDGGAVQSVALTANAGATGNPPYPITFATTDHYSVKLEGLTENSTIEFGTNADFALNTHSGSAPDIAPRVIVCGIKLSDEPLDANNPGGTTPEPEPDPTPGATKSIAEILALGEGASLSGTIEGIVISNMDLNNLTSKKGMYVQDETGALQFYLAANHEFAFGTKVKIDLTGATLGQYNGAVQISGLALDKITTVSTGNTVEPKKVSIADFLANKYEGQYIAIDGVQVAESDLASTWVMGGAHTSINMEDAAGNKFVVFSSKYATYGTETVAQGSGTIKGISSISKGAIQIIFAQASDYASLTGARLDGSTTPNPDPTPDPTPGTDGNFTKIETVADLAAGNYVMSAYLTSYSNANANFDWSSHPYHCWTGADDGRDCVTANYAFADGKLTLDPACTSGKAAVITLESAGKENTYYIKANGKYLYSTAAATSRKLALGTDKVEWVAQANSNGGITMVSNDVYLGTGGAQSNLIRSYKSVGSLLYGLVFFKAN